MKTLKILTLNTGLLRIRLFGMQIFDYVPYIKQRAAAIPKLLKKHDFDVIALQEVHFQKHKNYLIKELKDIYPYFHYNEKEHAFLSVNCGLLFLSKFPIVKKEYYEFKKKPWQEKIFAKRGTLLSTVRTPHFGDMTFANLHLTSHGLFQRPTTKSSLNSRKEQWKEASSFLETQGEDLILIGDFNSGPSYCNEIYHSILKKGFLDAYKLSPQYNSQEITWDPNNHLNLAGWNDESPAERVDHIFLPKNLKNKIQSLSSGILFKQPIVKIKKALKVTITDHYGLHTSITAK